MNAVQLNSVQLNSVQLNAVLNGVHLSLNAKRNATKFSERNAERNGDRVSERPIERSVYIGERSMFKMSFFESFYKVIAFEPAIYFAFIKSKPK